MSSEPAPRRVTIEVDIETYLTDDELTPGRIMRIEVAHNGAKWVMPNRPPMTWQQIGDDYCCGGILAVRVKPTA